jgi:ribose-phosphate pyrophosphokinase
MTKAVKDAGARDVYAAVTHGVFSPQSSEQIAKSGIKELVVTDTVEKTIDSMPKNVRIVSVAPLFAEAIRSIHERTSVSRLFGRD